MISACGGSKRVERDTYLERFPKDARSSPAVGIAKAALAKNAAKMVKVFMLGQVGLLCAEV